MAQFNILTADNAEIISKITEMVVSAYISARVLMLPPIDPDAHFEHKEARIINGIFDGTLPTDESFSKFKDMPEDEQPRYYRDIQTAVVSIIQAFFVRTGVNPITDPLSIWHRAVLYSLAVSAIQLVDIHETIEEAPPQFPQEEDDDDGGMEMRSEDEFGM